MKKKEIQANNIRFVILFDVKFNQRYTIYEQYLISIKAIIVNDERIPRE